MRECPDWVASSRISLMADIVEELLRANKKCGTAGR